MYTSNTGLVIFCTISTSIRGGLTEVIVNNLKKQSVVAASLIQTLSWKERKVNFVIKTENNVIEKVLFRLIHLIGADKLIEKLTQ